MQAVMITFDQAHHSAVVDLLNHLSCRGYTSFGEVTGRGSVKGDPHLGSHAWPAMGGAILTVVEDEKVSPLLERLHELDLSKPLLGLRAFVWPVTASV